MTFQISFLTLFLFFDCIFLCCVSAENVDFCGTMEMNGGGVSDVIIGVDGGDMGMMWSFSLVI